MRIGFWSIAFTILFFCFPRVVFANDDYDVGTYPPRNDYDLDTYQSYLHTGLYFNPFGDESMGRMINSMANAFFSCNKMISETIAYLIKMLFGLDVISKLIATCTQFGIALWDSLYSAFGVTLFLLTAVWIGFTAVLGHARRAIRQALLCCLVIGIVFAWKTVGGNYLQGIHTLTTEAQTQMMTAIASGNAKGESGVETVLHLYFDLTIRKPFLLMNYGTADEDEINAAKSNRSTSLLRKSVDAETWKEIDNYMAKHESTNLWLSPDKVYSKLSIAGSSVLFSLLLGIPFFVIGALNFFVQVIALFLFSLLPFTFMLSFIPSFSQAMFIALRNLLVVFAFKLVVGILFLLLMHVITAVQTLIPASVPYGYRIQIIVISLLLIVIYRKRNLLISTMTGGMLRKVEPEFVTRGLNKMESKAKQAAGAVITATTGVPVSLPQKQKVADDIPDKVLQAQSNRWEVQGTEWKRSTEPKRSSSPSPSLKESGDFSQQMRVNRTSQSFEHKKPLSTDEQNKPMNGKQDVSMNKRNPWERGKGIQSPVSSPPLLQDALDETGKVQPRSQMRQEAESKGSAELKRSTLLPPSEHLNQQVKGERTPQNKPVNTKQDISVRKRNPWETGKDTQLPVFIPPSPQDVPDEVLKVQPKLRTMQEVGLKGDTEPKPSTSLSPFEHVNQQVEGNRTPQNKPVTGEQDASANKRNPLERVKKTQIPVSTPPLLQDAPDETWKVQPKSQTRQEAESKGSTERKRSTSPSPPKNLNQQGKVEQNAPVNPLKATQRSPIQQQVNVQRNAQRKEQGDTHALVSASKPVDVQEQVNTRRKLFVEMQQSPPPPSRIKRRSENQKGKMQSERDLE